ncbi:MAG: SprT family zinc-dependent metalloprotease [bacterium]|nr:SprT family zinc-dependent metalloprotease [bacterium]
MSRIPEGYLLKRSKRKTLAVEVTRAGEVIVRAPLRMPEREILRFLSAQREWIDAHVALQKQREAAHPAPDAAEEARLKALAKEVIPSRVAHYGSIMGLAPTSVKITSAKTRFGSCSAKNGLCFSWRLMQYQMEAVDYVVVHELAHIVHKNHGKAFYALIGSVLPDYPERRKLLKE